LMWFAIGILPKACVCAYNHHHQHLSVFRPAILNRALELIFALQTGVTSHAWVLHHSLGHHVRYLDQSVDESRWQRKDGKTMGEMEYAFNVAVTAYPRAWSVGARYPRARRVFLWMGLLSLAIIIALVAYRPLPGLIVFVLAPAFSLWGTAWATYAHHAHRDTSTHFVASNNMLNRFYNKATCNLGYHTAHHFKPGVHWSKMPELHAEIAHAIPDDAYVEPGWPWRLVKDRREDVEPAPAE
jgi:fatty acid desaturase